MVQVSNPDGKQVSSSTVFNHQSANMGFGAANTLTMAATTRYVIAVDLDGIGTWIWSPPTAAWGRHPGDPPQ